MVKNDEAMSYVKLKTINFDFEGLRKKKTDAKASDTDDKKSSRQVIFLPKNSNEFLKSRFEKGRSRNHKKFEEMTPRKDPLGSSLFNLSTTHGAVNNMKFLPAPATTSKEVREALERMKTSYKISSQRSFSAPNVMNESSVAMKRRRQKTRFPLLAQRRDDITARTYYDEKLVVVGKKVSDSTEANQTEEITTAKEKPSDGVENVEKEENKVDNDDFIMRISFHDNSLSSFYGNRLSELPIVSTKAFKPLYTDSSISFNAYLRSRFGRSVYAREGDHSESLSKMKHCPLDWAPLIIKKQDLFQRNHVLRNTEV